jgi:hypothetical protein
MIAFGSPNAQEGLNSGLQYLQRAYGADPTHPGVLCVLSHFCLVKGMYDEVGAWVRCWVVGWLGQPWQQQAAAGSLELTSGDLIHQ